MTSHHPRSAAFLTRSVESVTVSCWSWVLARDMGQYRNPGAASGPTGLERWVLLRSVPCGALWAVSVHPLPKAQPVYRSSHFGSDAGSEAFQGWLPGSPAMRQDEVQRRPTITIDEQNSLYFEHLQTSSVWGLPQAQRDAYGDPTDFIRRASRKQ